MAVPVFACIMQQQQQCTKWTVGRIWVSAPLLHQKCPFNEPLRNQTKPGSLSRRGLGDRLRLFNICAEMAGRHNNVNNIETQFTINDPQSEQIKTRFWGTDHPWTVDSKLTGKSTRC